MKKLSIICISLFLFFGSTVGIFATEVVADNMVEYWLHDLLNQSYLGQNARDVTFGLGVGNSVTSYVVQIAQDGTFYVTYEVAPGDTVYFRWAQIRDNIPSIGSTVVNTSVNGSRVNSNTYTRAVSTSDDIGTYGTVLIVEDYTNTSSSTETVAYTITFNGDGGTAPGEYIPILCGTSVLINADKVAIDTSNIPTIDLTGVEDKLDTIIELLQTKKEDVTFEVPMELWQYYSYFINSFGYEYALGTDRIPYLQRTKQITEGFHSSLALRYLYQYDVIYFSCYFPTYQSAKPLLYGQDGSIINPITYKHSIVGSSGYGAVYTYKYTIPKTPEQQYSLYLPPGTQFDKFVPIYLGNEFGISDLISSYTGIETKLYTRISTIIYQLRDIYSVLLGSSNNSISENATNTNNQLSNSVTQFDNIEKEQVNNFTQNIANLPSFDFNGITDFSTTAHFVSTQMQNIYNSSEYIRFIYTAVLTFGIALVLIGRGLRR